MRALIVSCMPRQDFRCFPIISGYQRHFPVLVLKCSEPDNIPDSSPGYQHMCVLIQLRFPVGAEWRLHGLRLRPEATLTQYFLPEWADPSFA